MTRTQLCCDCRVELAEVQTQDCDCWWMAALCSIDRRERGNHSCSQQACNQQLQPTGMRSTAATVTKPYEQPSWATCPNQELRTIVCESDIDSSNSICVNGHDEKSVCTAPSALQQRDGCPRNCAAHCVAHHCTRCLVE